MVAFTPVFALPFENPGMPGVPGSGDQPGVTLHGGVPPVVTPLAEVIEGVLVAQVDTDVDLDTRLTILEAQIPAIRWRHIDSGVQVGSGTRTLVVPDGYERLRLRLNGNMSGTGNVNVRVNGDATAGRHIWGHNQFNAGSETIVFEHSGGANTVWRLGQWNTADSCLVEAEIWPSDGAQNPSYIAHSMQVSGTASNQRVQIAGGRFSQSTVVSSLEIQEGGGQTFTNLRWWLEGYLAP